MRPGEKRWETRDKERRKEEKGNTMTKRNQTKT